MSLIIHYPKRAKGPSITCFQDVKRIAPRMGLTDNTMVMLVERGFGSVQGIREMKEGTIEDLPLYAGQQLAISKLVAHLNEVLTGYDIQDALKEVPEEEQAAETKGAVTLDEDEKVKEDKKDNSKNAGILNTDGYAAGATGPRSVPRPHEYLVGKTNGRELNMEEFLYGNLLILEYMMEQDSPEVRAVMKHLRFMVLKLVHGYPVEQLIFYDYALRTKIEKDQTLMPLDGDSELLDKFKTYKDEKKKKKKGTKTKGKKKTKDKDENIVVGY